ncbi:MAG: 50S ribosomal protein L10 [Dehalococcoidales bacterium]
MPSEKKVQIINELQAVFSECSIAVLTDYRGLTTAEITDLRRTLKGSGITYRVVKNTLARFAAERTGKSELVNFFEGPVAIAFGYGDIVVPAKILADYIRNSKISLSIKGGFSTDRVFTPSEVETLATLPSMEVLLSKVLAGMQSPIATLINCLANPMRGFIGVLQARINQLEGG